MNLENRVAVVTGAGSGIGKAIVKAYAGAGARVVVADINEEGVNRVVGEIRAAGGAAISVVADVSKAEDVQAMVEAALNEYGSLDILVNNAGIMDNFMPVAELSEELWDRVFSINIKGPFLASRAALKIMLTQGKGVIVNIASVAGLFGVRGGAAYVASKHGVIGLTKNIAAVYHDQGIRCVAIAPGSVNTNIGATIVNPNELGAGKIAQGVGPSPIGEPEEIAAVALFLASDAASFINGTVVVADGGWTAY